MQYRRNQVNSLNSQFQESCYEPTQASALFAHFDRIALQPSRRGTAA